MIYQKILFFFHAFFIFIFIFFNFTFCSSPSSLKSVSKEESTGEEESAGEENFCQGSGKKVNYSIPRNTFLSVNDFICSNNGEYKLLFRRDNKLCLIKYNNNDPITDQGCTQLPYLDFVPQYGYFPAGIAGKFGLNRDGDMSIAEFCPTQKQDNTFLKLNDFSDPKNTELRLGDDGNLKILDENRKVLWDIKINPRTLRFSRNPDYLPCVYFKPKNPKHIRSKLPKPPLRYSTFYTKYKNLEGMDIMGTPSVPDSDLNLVAKQYQTMFNAFINQQDVKNFDGTRVFLMSYYDSPAEMTFFYYPGQNEAYYDVLDNLTNNLRGSTFNDGAAGGSLLITNEMICTKGVKTRGKSDEDYRGLDQVVHEMGHKIDFNLDLRHRPATIGGKNYTGIYDLIEKNGLSWKARGGDDSELVAYSFQKFFSQCYACGQIQPKPPLLPTTYGPKDIEPPIREYFETVLFDLTKANPIQCKKWYGLGSTIRRFDSQT